MSSCTTTYSERTRLKFYLSLRTEFFVLYGCQSATMVTKMTKKSKFV